MFLTKLALKKLSSKPVDYLTLEDFRKFYSSIPRYLYYDGEKKYKLFGLFECKRPIELLGATANCTTPQTMKLASLISSYTEYIVVEGRGYDELKSYDFKSHPYMLDTLVDDPSIRYALEHSMKDRVLKFLKDAEIHNML